MNPAVGGVPVTDDALHAPRPVPWDGVGAWLRSSQELRRLVPYPVARVAVDLAQRAALLRSPERLAAARASMAAVVGGTYREPDLERLARCHLSSRAQAWEFSWRPWRMERVPVVGAERLAGLEPGRGVIVSTPHFGSGLSPLPRLLGPVLTAVGDHLVSPVALPGYHGYQNEHVRKRMTRTGFRMVRARGCRQLFAEALRSGGRVLLNIDVPGSTSVSFLGKPVELASGTGRLAFDTDAVVLPVIALPRGHAWYVHIDDPLDPRHFERWEDLLQATATVLGDLILRAPEYLESPLRQSGWAVATPDGWRRAA